MTTNDLTTGTKIQFFDGMDADGVAHWQSTVWEVEGHMVGSDPTVKIYTVKEVRIKGKPGPLATRTMTLVDGCGYTDIKVIN